MNHIIALTPTDLAPAQKTLLTWVDARVEHWIKEQKEATAGRDHAIKNKWNRAPFVKLVNKANHRIGFYRKIKTAIEMGYLIVPNFPLDIFAIRTNAVDPRGDESTARWQDFRQSPRVLPQGEGRYANPLPVKASAERESDDGKTTKTVYFPIAIKDELEIPFNLVRPEIMQAVDVARKLKLFDQIGISSDRRGDPIICGQIIEKNHLATKRCTFFIAWYIDLDTL